MLLIAPVKELSPARFGHKLLLKHVPDLPLRVNDDLYRRLKERFYARLALWARIEHSQLLVIGTFSQPMTGVFELEAACLVNVNEGWLPFETAHEFQLLEALADRRFTKGERYNLPSTKPMASMVLHDTEKPTALYLIPPEATAEYAPAVRRLAEDSGLASWWWRCCEGALPDLPAAVVRHGEVAQIHPESQEQA